MSSAVESNYDSTEGPFEVLYRVAEENDWQIERWDEDAAIVSIEGSWQEANVAVSWHGDTDVLMFTIPLDLKLGKSRLTAVRRIVCAVNAMLLVGHFDFANSNRRLALRYSLVMSDSAQLQDNQLLRTIIVLNEAVQRFFPAFKLAMSGVSASDSLNAALIDPQGQA